MIQALLREHSPITGHSLNQALPPGPYVITLNVAFVIHRLVTLTKLSKQSRKNRTEKQFPRHLPLVVTSQRSLSNLITDGVTVSPWGVGAGDVYLQLEMGFALLHPWHCAAESCPEHVFISLYLFWEAPDLPVKTLVEGRVGGEEGWGRGRRRQEL